MRLSLFRSRRDGGRSRRHAGRGVLHLGRVHLAHESLEQRQMLDGSGPTVLTDAQYQARLATLNGAQSAALSGAATAQAAADQAWKDA